jgi:hypothetical protein
MWHVGLEVRRITELVLLTLHIIICLVENSKVDTHQKNRKTTHWCGHWWQRLDSSVGYHVDSWYWLLHNDIIQRSLI